MRQLSLGRADVTVSEIAFGCGPGARLMVSDDSDAQQALVNAAIAAGVTYFDTAAGYGSGRSEQNLGEALRRAQASPVISTKVALELPDLDDISGAIIGSVESSLERLGRSRVELLVLHNRVARGADYPKPAGSGALLHLPQVFGGDGVVEAFRSLIDQGLVGSVGFTAFGGEPSAIEEMIDCGLFTSMNASYNLLNPSAKVPVPAGFVEPDYERVIDKARRAGIGVMAIRVLASGALADEESLDDRVVRFAALARELGISLPQLAIRFVLSTEGVQTAIMGLSEPSHLVAAVEAAMNGPLEAAVMGEIEAIAISGNRPAS
jgi:aryl-alcohol dehydrogenase-like predicted oxidoreductase